VIMITRVRPSSWIFWNGTRTSKPVRMMYVPARNVESNERLVA
jgi:hypothetical protein